MLSGFQFLVLSALLAWAALFVASVLRTKAWTGAGLGMAFGNREYLPGPSHLAGRAGRAAQNLMESLLLFAVVLSAAHFRGTAGVATDIAAAVFFWARLAYWPVYLVGVPYVRTGLWWVAIAALGVIGWAAFHGA